VTTWRFTVEGNPIPKARARSGNGRHYTPATTRVYETKVKLAARHLPCLEGPVRVQCTFYRANAVPCDLDNLVKSILDGINGRAFKDDRQIVWLEAVKAIDRDNPRTEVELETVEEVAA
jgi:crossover junction endodeoxyribonuclease RusA